MPPISVLDLSPVAAGSTESQALRDTIELARHADRLGYERYWLAEHHGGAMVASSSPELMIGQVAAATEGIRVGSGGVMLPNHSPLRVAEQFKVLSALFGDRIDLGIGRAPGTDQMTAYALRRSREAMAANDLPEQLGELLAFAGVRPWPDGHAFSHVRAAPFEAPLPPIYLLGSSDYSARLAASAGLGFAFAGQINPELAVDALRLYRDEFQPSELFAEPYAIVSHAVVVAEDDETADRLAAPSRVAFRRLRAGRPTALPTVEDALAEEGPQHRPPGRPGRMIVGSPITVRDRIDELMTRSGADELMAMTNVHDAGDRRRSYELLAEAYALEPRAGGVPA
ncbi:MAG: LLM class flavin-dependent oxidoreductase [Solirubrobacterales bacterium]|nr:LLM class flavin-dependent oxidoreductase [Solirubrobacterales bacterium]